MTLRVRDRDLEQTAALPNGAASTTTTGFDLGHNSAKQGRLLAQCELEIVAPALTTAELPDGQTITYHVEHADDAAFSVNLATEHSTVRVQTGAAGAGAAGATDRVRLPTQCKRFVRVKATKTGAANASAKSMSAALVF